MADQKISELTALTSGTTEDYLPIVDKSASATKRILIPDLLNSGVTTLNFLTSAVSRDVVMVMDQSGTTVRKMRLDKFLFGSLLRAGVTTMPKTNAGVTVLFSSAFATNNYIPIVSLKTGSGATYLYKRTIITRNYTTTGMWIGVTPVSAAKDITVCYSCFYLG